MDGDIVQHGNDAADKEVARLWRTWRTVHEMLADRVSELCETFGAFDKLLEICGTVTNICPNKQGYEVSDNELTISLDQFRRDYADSLGFPEYAPPQNLFTGS